MAKKKSSGKYIAVALLLLFNNEILSLIALIALVVMFLGFLVNAAENRA